ncbi:MAG: hypothetical protein AB7I25_11320 [Vicinamibacterales bacterium]
MSRPVAAQTVAPAADGHAGAELRALFHRLNNQLGIILAHAELLEVKAGSEPERQRAAQIVASALDAMMTVRSIRDRSAEGTSPASH